MSEVINHPQSLTQKQKLDKLKNQNLASDNYLSQDLYPDIARVVDSQSTSTYPSHEGQNSGLERVIQGLRERSIDDRLASILTAKLMKNLLEGLNINQVLERRKDLLRLTRTEELNLGWIDNSTSIDQFRKIFATSAHAYFSGVQPVDRKYSFGSREEGNLLEETITVPPVMTLNKTSLELYSKSMSLEQKKTCFVIGADVAGFGQVNNVGSGYADDKKQELSLSLLNFVKTEGGNIVTEVLTRLDKNGIFKADEFDIDPFNNNKSDEYSVCVACNSREISNNKKTLKLLADINKEIAIKIGAGFIQHLGSDEGQILSFTSPTPLADEDVPNRTPLGMRFEEEFFNYPHTVADIAKIPNIEKAYLNVKSGDGKYQQKLLKTVQAFWLKMRDTGLKGFEDFGLLFEEHLQHNYNLQTLDLLPVAAKKVEQKKAQKQPESGLPQLTTPKDFDNSKYEKSPWYSYLITSIDKLLKDVPQGRNNEEKVELYTRIDNILDNFNLKPINEKVKNRFPNMNLNLLKSIFEITKKLDKTLWDNRQVVFLKLTIKGHNNVHSIGDHIIAQAQLQMVETFEQSIEQGLSAYTHLTPDVRDIVTKAVVDSSIMSSMGPCPIMVFANHYNKIIDKEYPGEDKLELRSQLKIICNDLINKGAKAVSEITEIKVNIPEGDSKTSMFPAAGGVAEIGDNLAKSIDTAEVEGKHNLNDFFIKNMSQLEDFSDFLGNLHGFEDTGKYSLQGKTWPDVMLSSMCEAKRGLPFCISFAARLLELVKYKPEIVKNLDLTGILDMINKITEKLIANKVNEANNQKNEGVKKKLLEEVSRMQQALNDVLDLFPV